VLRLGGVRQRLVVHLLQVGLGAVDDLLHAPSSLAIVGGLDRAQQVGRLL
jgi:hypothetical protein